jgi:hydrogenase-4 component E
MLDVILMLLVLFNLFSLGSTRISASIRVVAYQGAAIGVVPLFLPGKIPGGILVTIVLVTLLIKAGILPWFLRYAQKRVNVRREEKPFVGASASILSGVAALGTAFFISSRLPIPFAVASPFIVPVALSVSLTGFFIIISRAEALSQVIGYLILENGIYLFGIALLLEQPLLVELGMLLDVFVGIFVMGITVFHISREFEHTDTSRLSGLADWLPEVKRSE